MNDVTATRIVIFGNSGSGKTTMARMLAAEHAVPHLDLDSLAWSKPAVRRPLAESAALIARYVESEPEWIIEGCYADLLDLVLPHATEVRFLNPGTAVCVANCRARPWEPEKYSSIAEQDEKLAFLLDWVQQYETRDDEYSLAAHRRLFDGFAGVKREFGAMTEE